MITSVFLPLARLPVVGDVSYHRIAELESYLVVLFSLTATILLFTGRTRYLFVSVVGVWGTLLYPALEKIARPAQEGFLAGVKDKAAGMMRDFAADLFLNVVEFSWGGYIFLLALVSLTLSAVFRSFKR